MQKEEYQRPNTNLTLDSERQSHKEMSYSFPVEQGKHKNKQRILVCIIIILIIICAFSFSYIWILESKIQEDQHLGIQQENKGKLVNDQQLNQTINKEFTLQKENYLIQNEQKNKKTINDLQKQISEKNNKINDLQKQISEKNNKINDLQKQISEKYNKINDLQKQISEKNNKINDLQKQISEKNNKINDLQKQISEKNNKINDLQKQISEKSKNTETPQSNTSHLQLVDLLLTKNEKGKGISDVLYKSEQTRNARSKYIEDRNNFIRSKQTTFPHAWLIKYNLIDKQQMLEEGVRENQKDWQRLQQKFKISSVKEELPMCIIAPGYNNNAQFRIEANLNSIFLQNYTNLKAVIINDKSTDGSDEVFRAYFDFYKIDKAKYIYIENTVRKTALQNLYLAAMYNCSQNSIIIIVDGDDQLIGRNTLNLFNWAAQDKKAGVLYSNYYAYGHQKYFYAGFTKQYSDQERANNLYRSISPAKVSHLRASRASLYHELKVKDLQDQKGDFLKVTYDLALFLPLMELSCGRVFKIEDQFNLLYRTDTGLNEFEINRQKQVQVEKLVRNYPRYECSKTFNQAMNKK